MFADGLIDVLVPRKKDVLASGNKYVLATGEKSVLAYMWKENIYAFRKYDVYTCLLTENTHDCLWRKVEREIVVCLWMFLFQ